MQEDPANAHACCLLGEPVQRIVAHWSSDNRNRPRRLGSSDGGVDLLRLSRRPPIGKLNNHIQAVLLAGLLGVRLDQLKILVYLISQKQTYSLHFNFPLA